MTFRKFLCLLVFLISIPTYGSTFSDEEFPFQHDYCPSSSDSEFDEKHYNEVIGKNWAELQREKQENEELREKEIFRGECKGLKKENSEKPFNLSRGILARLGSYYRDKLRWMVRRIGSDRALSTYMECYCSHLMSEQEKQSLENAKISYNFQSTRDLIEKTTNAYVLWYISQNEGGTHIFTQLFGYKGPFLYEKTYATVIKMKVKEFLTQFIPQLKDEDLEADVPRTWILFAYEKACIYFMKDYTEALRKHLDEPNTTRHPFQDLVIEPSSQLYIELKPEFKKGYKMKDVNPSVHYQAPPTRFDLREERLRMSMGDLFIETGGYGVGELEIKDNSDDKQTAASEK